jgi:hypothetical protein
MSYAFSGHSNTIATFPVSPHDRYHMPIMCRRKDGMFQKINVLADSGNDVTLLKLSTSKMLGFEPMQEMGDVFPVGGITGGPQHFKKIWNTVMIGGLRPMYIRMGLAYMEESLAEDLLGRQDVFDSGKLEVTYDDKGVSFREKHDPLDITTSDYAGGQLSYRVREAFRSIK